MTIPHDQISEKRPANAFAVGALVCLLLLGIIMIGRHFLTQSSPSLVAEMDLDKHPIPAWIAADAKQCQGDIAKLSPTEQQKVRASYPGQGARTILMAAFATQH